MIKLFIFTLIFSCGKIRTENRVILEGETKSRVNVNFEFITQLKELCENLYFNDTDSKQKISKCVLDRLSFMNILKDESSCSTYQYSLLCDILDREDLL